MYRDLTENKPPLGYWLYALAVALGGYNELAIRVLAIPAVLADDRPALVDRIAACRRPGRLPGCWPLCVAQHRSVPLRQRIEYGTFHEPVLGGVASADRSGMEFEPCWPLLAAGACVGAAALVKQVAILPAALYAVALMFRWRGERGRETAEWKSPCWRCAGTGVRAGRGGGPGRACPDCPGSG